MQNHKKEMKKIPLTKGQFALVDDEDFESLNRLKWYAKSTKWGYYAVRRIRVKTYPFRKTIYMHRVIAKSNMPDHRDGNGLNNTRLNLRKATEFQNRSNANIGSLNTSGFKGVTWDKKRGKWIAQLQSNYSHIQIGRFSTAILAAAAYDNAAKRIFGEFARTNKMLGLI